MEKIMNLFERLVTALENQNELYVEYISTIKSMADKPAKSSKKKEKAIEVAEDTPKVADVETFAEVQAEEVAPPQLPIEDAVPFHAEEKTEPMTRRELQNLVIANFDNSVENRDLVTRALNAAGVRRAVDLQENGDCEKVWEEYKRLKGIA